MRVNGEREDEGHSTEEKGGRNREREEDCLQFFPSPHTDSDLTDPDASDGSKVRPTELTLSSSHTPERCENDTETTEVRTAVAKGDVPFFTRYKISLKMQNDWCKHIRL